MFGLTIIAVIGEKCVVLHCGNLRSRNSWLYSHLTNHGSALHASSAVWPELPTPAADYYLCNVSQYCNECQHRVLWVLFVKQSLVEKLRFWSYNSLVSFRRSKCYYCLSVASHESTHTCLRSEWRMPVYISKAEVPTTELQFGEGGSYIPLLILFRKLELFKSCHTLLNLIPF